MHVSTWKSALKSLVLAVVVFGLVCELPIVPQTSTRGPREAYAQRHGGHGGMGGGRAPRGQVRRPTSSPGGERPGGTPPRSQVRPAPSSPGGQRPGGGVPGQRPSEQRPPDYRPGNMPGNRPGSRPPEYRPPSYGPGRPVPPRPSHIPPPHYRGPWTPGPWWGAGPSPWWYGRPFLWTVTATATVVAIAGITYYMVDGMYYRPYVSEGTTVYVQVDVPR